MTDIKISTRPASKFIPLVRTVGQVEFLCQIVPFKSVNNYILILV